MITATQEPYADEPYELAVGNTGFVMKGVVPNDYDEA